MQTKGLNSCILFGKLAEIWLFQSAVSYADSMPALRQRTSNVFKTIPKNDMRITTEKTFAFKPTD